MFRSITPNFILHRGTCSTSVLTNLLNTSLKAHDNLRINNIRNNTHQTVTNNNVMEIIFPIMSSKSSLDTCKEKPLLCISSSKLNNQHLLDSGNYVLTKRSALPSILASPLSRHNFTKISCSKPLGARQFSSEATRHVPLVQLTGIWKDISECAPVQFVQDTLVNFQSATNLPWWATIIITTFIVRSTFTLPLSLYQHYIFAKVQNLKVEMNPIVKNFQNEANIGVSRYGWTEYKARVIYDQRVAEKWDELIQQENCHPAKGFIVLWTQIPLWLTISAALRNSCYMLPATNMNAEKVWLELTNGGFGWVVNLVDVDHYWILPICVGLSNLVNIEIMSLGKIQKETKLQKYLLYFLRFVSIAMVPISAHVPSCLALYWLSSSTFGLLQNLLLLSPKVRRLGGVPMTPTEKANPYRHLITQFKAKKYFNFTHKSEELK